MKPQSRIVVKIKKPQLYDEYIITNKHIICKFKYIFICFDSPEQKDTSYGLVCLRSNRLKELITEQNITFDYIQETGFLFETFKQLKDWHPAIDKIEVECDKISELTNLINYPISWNNYYDYLHKFKYNHCIIDEHDFDMFKNSIHNIVDVNVYFKLTKRIEKISDYNVNFNYLRKLLTEGLIESHNNHSLFLDEVTVKFNQLPFASNIEHDKNEDTYYVYPYMGLLPLYP